MSRIEYVSPEGLRLDGRRPGETRRIRCRMGVLSKADGSSYLEMGNTKVMASVYGPREVAQQSQSEHDRAIIRCEYSSASFSSGERRRKQKNDKKVTEIGLLLQQTFESVLFTNLYPRSQIDIFVQVLQSDGGTLCACINAATMALVDAGIPMQDLVVACSAGYLDGTPLVDLNYIEDGGGGPELPVACLPRRDTMSLVQMGAPLPLEQLDSTLRLAIEGCRQVYKCLVDEARDYTLCLLDTRGAV